MLGLQTIPEGNWPGSHRLGIQFLNDVVSEQAHAGRKQFGHFLGIQSCKGILNSEQLSGYHVDNGQCYGFSFAGNNSLPTQKCQGNLWLSINWDAFELNGIKYHLDCQIVCK